MVEEIKIVEHDVEVEVSFKDQVAVAVLCAVAGLVASKLTEKAYYNVKGRYLLNKASAHKQ